MSRLLILFLLSLLSCQNYQDNSTAVAKAFGNQLTMDDLSHHLRDSETSEDSNQIITKMTDNWLMDEILFNEAKKKISSNDKLEALVNDYRKALYLQELEQSVLNEELDTTVTRQMVDQLFEQYQAEYLLEQNMIKVLMLKIPESGDTEQLQAIWTTEDILALRAISQQELSFGLLDLKKWYQQSEVEALLPEEVMAEINLTKTKTYKVKAQGYLFLIKVIDFVKEGEPAPRTLVDKQIKQRLLLDRKKELLNNWKKELYQNNIQSKDIHLYK